MYQQNKNLQKIAKNSLKDLTKNNIES